MRSRPACTSSCNRSCIGSGSNPQDSWTSGIVATPGAFDRSVPRCDCSTITAKSFRACVDTLSVEADILEINRLIVDAAHRRSDPVGEFAWLDDAAHQRLHVSM